MCFLQGIDVDYCFNLVHKSNMSKLCNSKELAEKTVQWYKDNSTVYDSPDYKYNDELRLWIVFNKSTGKVLKSIEYSPVSFIEYLDRASNKLLQKKKQKNKTKLLMKSEIKDGVLVISLAGNLLGETANAPVMDLIKQNVEAGNKKVVFNLTELKFINSTGLGMLLTAVSKARNAGGELALCNLPEQLKKLLQILPATYPRHLLYFERIGNKHPAF